MVVTLSGISMLDKLLQPLNASSPIEVTLSGIVILVSPLQFLNAESPMLQKRPFPSFPSCIVLFTDTTRIWQTQGHRCDWNVPKCDVVVTSTIIS